ncbi:MAG: efflux transporter outer membrane subunit [Pseudomonadota bacterium]
MFKHVYFLPFLSLAACVAVGPRYEEPDFAAAQNSFVYADRPVYVASEEESDEPIAWWEAFSDPHIAEVVELARERNLDLRQAVARLEAAQARAGAARAALLPQGATSFSITRQEQAQAAFAGFAAGGPQDPNAPPPPPVENPEFTLYQAQQQVSWEVDLFGRLRRQTQAASARAKAEEQGVADAHRLITGQAVDTYILLVEAMNRRRVAMSNLELQERNLALVEDLYELGEVPKLDLLRTQTEVKNTAAQVLVVENAAADATASLALLLGMTVPEFVMRFSDIVAQDAKPSMPEAQGVIALREPADVLRRRPDVAAAERRLAAEVYDVGVETAGLFPQITLDGTASLIALDFDGLSDPNAFGYTAGPRISWQILNYPRLLQQRAAAKAEVAGALAAYEQTVLQALTETDRALALHTGAVEQAVLLTEAQVTAEEAQRLAALRYREGADSLLSLIDAQRVALQSEDAAVQAQAAALRTRAAIHRVLAD